MKGIFLKASGGGGVTEDIAETETVDWTAESEEDDF